MALAREGAAVAFNYSRTEDEAEAAGTLGLLAETGATAWAARTDVADAAAVAAFFAECRTQLGGPADVLVNNAAVAHDGLAMLLSDDAWERVLAVNLTGAWRCCRAALRG